MQKNICICVISLIFLCSCSNVPKVAKYPVSFQQKMQSAHHWDVLAADIAKEFKSSLQANVPAGTARKVYLEPNQKSTFNDTFDTLLRTQLFKQGIELTPDDAPKDECEGSYVKMNYETQMVKHKGIRCTSPLFPGQALMLTALGAGVYKAFSSNNDTFGAFAAAGAVELINGLDGPFGPLAVPHHEVVITTELTMNNSIIARRSNIYYINDADYMHYLEEIEIPTKNYTVVGK